MQTPIVGGPSRMQYLLRDSPYGRFAVLFEETAAQPRVSRVLLPPPVGRVIDLLRGDTRFGWRRQKCSGGAAREPALSAGVRALPPGAPGPARIRAVADRIQEFLSGKALCFDLGDTALDTCPPFQQAVLRAEHRIPRGRVSTYGRIATALGRPRAARAVGMALATNPFPIIVPCHRAIRADGHLGGYQGGTAAKRALLATEGVHCDRRGRVMAPRWYY